MKPGYRYKKCPDCGKRGVHLVMPGGGTREDNYQCRHCDFFVFLLSNAEVDVKNLKRLQQVNGDTDL